MSIATTAKQWIQARDIIAQFLCEINPDGGYTQQEVEHNAAAIIARLASSDPPILLAYPNELKDE